MNKALRNPLIYTLFVLPAFILFLAFFIYPIYTAFDNSFTSWNGISKNAKYIGFDNYSKALEDIAFWKSVKNNVYFILFSCFVQVPIIVLFSLLIANVKKLKGLYKTAVFAPSIMSTAVIGILWGFIYNPDFGLMNEILGLFGVEPIYWLSEKKWAMISILITNAWQWTGFYIVMVLPRLFPYLKNWMRQLL